MDDLTFGQNMPRGYVTRANINKEVRPIACQCLPPAMPLGMVAPG